MGIIDSRSEYSLYDVVDGTMTASGSGEAEEPVIEFFGFFINATSPDGGSYVVSYESHVGTVMEFESDEYDDVLELVEDLIHLIIRANDFDYRDDMEGLVEWAGRQVVDDPEKVEERPDLFMTLPTRSPGDL